MDMVLYIMLATAAQVVGTLLLRSGDVELNPGPTGRFPDLDYDNVDNIRILGEDDMQAIMEELMQVKTRYKTFGMVLGLNFTELEAIQRANMFDIEDALTMVVVTWLRQKYNTIKYGLPTWRRIVEAVDSEAGGNNHSLAKRIAECHQASTEETCNSHSKPSSVCRKSTPPTSLNPRDYHSVSGNLSRPASPVNVSVFGIGGPIHGPSSTLSLENVHGTCRGLLATCYIEQTEDIEEYNWPPVKYNAFVPFTMIKQKSKQHSTVRQQVDSTLVGEDTILYTKFLHDVQMNSGKLMLIEGRPGSGKSSLVIEISKDWAKGELLPSKLFFLVRLRMLHGQDKLTLFSMLSTLFEDLSASGLLESLCSYITTQSGESVVFALDGLDEYSPRSRDDFIQKLITKRCLPKSTVIVTSRPAATQGYRRNASMVIEVIGFTGKQIPDYVNRHFSDDWQKAQSLISHLQQHHNLMNACYLPLHLNMLVFLYQEDIELPATETQMYNHVTLSTLLRSVKKRESDESQDQVKYLESFSDLPPEDKLMFDKICKLAFDATLSLKQSFTSTELNDKRILKPSSKGRCQDMLGLVVVDRKVCLRGQFDVYSFFHLTFQEYLASIHIAGLDPSQTLQLAKKYRNDSALKLVWKFVCGSLDYSLHRMTINVILQSEQCKNIMTKIYFAQESQQELCCSYVVGDNMVRPPTKKQLTISECSALGYVVSKAAVVKPTQPVAIDFEKTYFNNDGVIAFLEHVAHIQLDLRVAGTKSVYPFLEGLSRCPIQGLVQIKLVHAKLGVAEIQKFVIGTKTCLYLQKLVLIESNVDVAELKVLGDALKQWKNLEAINLDNNKFGEKGAEIFGRALVYCPTLRSINLSRNKLGDTGAAFLADGLSYCKRLEELSLEKNDLNDAGFISLMQSLKCHKNLHKLNICKNSISDHGVQALVSCPVFVKLTVLNLRENKIGDKGVKILVEGTISNKSMDLMILDLFSNSITNEGLLHLNRLIQVAFSLELLDVRGNQFNDFEKLREAESRRTEEMAKIHIRA